LARAAKTLLSLGAPDCPVVHRTVSGAPGWHLVNCLLLGLDGGVRLKITGLSGGAPDYPVSRLRRSRRSRESSQQRTTKIHRTVRWCTGLSGGAPDCPVSQRSAAQSARDAWPGQRSDGGTGQCPVRQRLQIFNGRLRQNRKAISTEQCPVVHRTVRCTTRQKARIVFLDCSQQLLAALGL
jgi:hypothetical protein